MKQTSRRSGFTLAELLISISLTMIALGIAVPFFLAQSRSLQAQSGRLDAQLNVNFSLDGIDRELRVAGVGITNRQPLLVQAATDAITFNADLASTAAGDFSAVYYDPDASAAATSMFQPADKITLPNSAGWMYPDSAYWAAAGVPSNAETISYYVVDDAALPGLKKLMRRVNDDTARVVARGIKPVAGDPYFRYFKLSLTGTLVEVASGSLPKRHLPGWHGAPGDTNQVALVDSIVLVKIKFTAVHRDPRFPDAARVEERTVRISNAGLVRASTCGDVPLIVTGLARVATAAPQVTLTWTRSADETTGEKDVERYSIYRRDPLTPVFGDPLAIVSAGVPAPSFVDTDVKPGETWIYGVAAQDCTPSLSPMAVAAAVVIP